MEWKIPLFKIYSDQNDIDAVGAVIKRGTYWADGPEIKTFEKEIQLYTGRKYVLVFNSGTSALHTLLLSHNIKGKEVIIPSFTFTATANAVLLAGGIPVFAEVEEDTFALDFEDVKKRITKNTTAIMPIHYGGTVARDIKKLKKLCDQRGILLLEDAAQSLGATLKGKMAGTFGQSAIYSLCQNKLLAAGEGGLLVTDDENIYQKAKLFRSHGRVEEVDDFFSNIDENEYIELGYNFRMPSMIAALSSSQLRKIDKVIGMRRAIAAKYSERLGKIASIRIPDRPEEWFQTFQMYTILLPDKRSRDCLQQHLKEKGIMSKVYFNPVHLMTYYRRELGQYKGSLPKTELLSNRALNIPLFPHMSKEEVELVLDSIENLYEEEK